MNTVESLYRYYKKVGPAGFELFIKEHPELVQKAKAVKEIDSKVYAVA